MISVVAFLFKFICKCVFTRYFIIHHIHNEGIIDLILESSNCENVDACTELPCPKYAIIVFSKNVA